MKPVKGSEKGSETTQTASAGPMIGALVGFVGGFGVVWLVFGGSHLNQAELFLSALGGAVFAILGALLGRPAKN